MYLTNQIQQHYLRKLNEDEPECIKLFQKIFDEQSLISCLNCCDGLGVKSLY